MSADLQQPDSEKVASHHGWTIMLISAGIGLIACCVLIPQADENRKMAYECQKLKMDLGHLDKQVAVNQEFISRLGRDPGLAERLAQRQMKFIRSGTRVLELDEGVMPGEESAFSLVSIAPPAQMPPLELRSGRMAELCRDAKVRLYAIGTGMMLVACGLVLGATPGKLAGAAGGREE
ncbi:MAG TPA: hypothetical protein VGQ99_10640 [Tepidisphaeraceae bacterium]|jgi:hypothetical protein|nr:hypothetical protein [Tepidisphaeraceae bacterium]